MYSKVESVFWTDEKMRSVSSDARHLMLYLFTSPHRNIMALYYLPIPYACFDLGWDEQRFNNALQELLDIGRVKYDTKSHIVLVKNFLKYNPLENKNQVTSAINKLNELPETPLFQDFLEIAEVIDSPFIKPLLERLGERLEEPLGKPFGKGLREGLPQPVTVTEAVKKDEEDEDNARARGEIIQQFEQEFGRPLSPMESQEISQWMDDHPHELITQALKEAVLHGAMRFKYIDTILNNWKKNNILTVREAIEYASKRKSKVRGDPLRDTCEDLDQKYVDIYMT